ncbi:MAG: hypothetical protein SVT56_03815 [Chloroflexota bacterium]|nr:hypothetical protein [Chloroflexota bacterium]
MKSVIKTVYYCDHCGKRYLSKYWGEKHEKHCTLNPNRDCRMCDYVGTLNNIPEILDSIFNIGSAKEIFPLADEIFETTGGCPQCTLTILRLLESTPRFQTWNHPKETQSAGFFTWSYEKACEEFWRLYNEEMRAIVGSEEIFYD